MGFYYGQEAAENGGAGAGQQTTAQVLQISDPRADPAAPVAGANFGIISQVSGGDPPYKYTITFDPANIIQAPPPDQTSSDGNINHRFTVPPATASGTAIKYTIKASDKDTRNKELMTRANSPSAAHEPTSNLNTQRRNERKGAIRFRVNSFNSAHQQEFDRTTF